MSGFRMSSTYRRVFVQQIDEPGDGRILASVVDLQTGSVFSLTAFAPDGSIVRPGQMWMCTTEVGMWRFSLPLSPAPWEDSPEKSFSDVLARFEGRGLLHWRPDDAADPPARPHLAYLGEVRLFIAGINPSGWLECNGQSVSRNRWRDLFLLFGTDYGVGDGSSTFGLPSITPPAVASGSSMAWYICGE